jgi:hypothetical protein
MLKIVNIIKRESKERIHKMNNEKEMMTYQEGSCEDLYVKRGEHGILINGQYYFRKDQFEKNNNSYINSNKKFYNGRWL